jgi:pyridoxine 4-dehydrogenase
MSGPKYRESLLSTVPLDEKEIGMSKVEAAGTFALGPHCVKRLGYGAMQLAGPGVYGPPRDRAMAIAILREAVESGVNHIDTSDYYGPHITNQIIRDALHPYRHELVIVTKVGARHGTDASWKPAMTRDELTQAVHDNLRYLGLDVLGVLNLRRMFADRGTAEGSLKEPLTVLAELQHRGLIRHIGLSNVTLPRSPRPARSAASPACRTSTISLIAATMR